MDTIARRLAHEFDQVPGLVYLNHAAVAPWPRRTADAVRRFTDENVARGAQHYPRWLEEEETLRRRLAALINAPSSADIALLKNTSEGLSLLAYGLDWRPGDNAVISAEEFPSNRIVWESLARFGVEVREADLTGASSPEDALLAQIDDRSRVLAISSVQYASGRRVDLTALGAACRAKGVLLCVDAIQSVGAVAFDVQACQADIAVADGHKWMLGPEGLAFFYCRPELRERLQLHQYGWHMVEDYMDFDRRDWRPAASARRFECGSPNMLAIHALSASIGLLLELGMDEVERRVLDNARYLMQVLGHDPAVSLVTPTAPGRHAGIVAFRHARIDAQVLHRRLMEHQVICAVRGGALRLSPHCYNTRAELDRALELVAGT